MKNCKTKKTLFLGMTTLLSSLILFGCNSGGSAQNVAVGNTGSSIDVTKVTRFGEPITAFTSDGRYMFSIGSDKGDANVIYLTAINPHVGAVSNQIQSVHMKGGHNKIVAITLVKDKYLFAISSSGFIGQFVLSGTSSGKPYFEQYFGIDNHEYTPSPSAMTSSLSAESIDGFLFIVDSTNKYVQIGSVDNNGVLTLNHELDKMGRTGNGPNSITVLKNGKAAYVTNSQDNSISQFRVDVADLKVSRMKKQQFATCPQNTGCGGSSPSDIELSPNDQYAYVADYGGNYINIYNVDSSNGYLSYQGYISAGNNPSSIHIAQNGLYAYVYNSDKYNPFPNPNPSPNPSISQYAISNNGSTLTPLGKPIFRRSLSADNKPDMMTTDNKGHIYAYNYVARSVEIYSALQNGSAHKGDDCDYQTFSYGTQGPISFQVPACASYMTQIAVGGGGGGGGRGVLGGHGGIGFARDVPVTVGGVKLHGFVGGGGGSGVLGGYGGAPGASAYYARNGYPGYSQVNNLYGGGGGGGGSDFLKIPYYFLRPHLTVYAGGGGGGGGGWDGSGNDVCGKTDVCGGGGADGYGIYGGYGGAGGFSNQFPQIDGGNGTGSIFTPNSIFFPSNISNGATQGLLMVMFTTKPIGSENYWLPGGKWTKTCVPGPRFYTPANTTFETAPAGAIDYVCIAGQNGGTMLWNPGTLQMSDTATNPLYYNRNGLPAKCDIINPC